MKILTMANLLKKLQTMIKDIIEKGKVKRANEFYTLINKRWEYGASGVIIILPILEQRIFDANLSIRKWEDIKKIQERISDFNKRCNNIYKKEKQNYIYFKQAYNPLLNEYQFIWYYCGDEEKALTSYISYIDYDLHEVGKYIYDIVPELDLPDWIKKHIYFDMIPTKQQVERYLDGSLSMEDLVRLIYQDVYILFWKDER